MPRLDAPTLQGDRPTPRFREANPAPFARAQGDVDATRRLAAIETRATAIKDRFRAHFDRNEELWVVREAMSLTAKRTFPTLQHPRPRGVVQNNFAELMMGQARRNVHARALNRMSNINTTKTAMQNAVLRNAPKPAQAQRQQPSNDAGSKQAFRQATQKQKP